MDETLLLMHREPSLSDGSHCSCHLLSPPASSARLVAVICFMPNTLSIWDWKTSIQSPPWPQGGSYPLCKNL